jgi:hypothetical protein
MAHDFVEETINKFKLKGVIEFISNQSGETMLELVGIYEGYYGSGNANAGFIKHCLEKLFVCHEEGSNFQRRTDIAEEERRRILQEIILSKIYRSGERWLINNGHAEKVPRF